MLDALKQLFENNVISEEIQESIEKAKEDPDFEKKTKEIFDQIQSELNEKIKL